MSGLARLVAGLGPAALGFAGLVLLSGAGALAGALRARRRAALIAQAAHELRGPLAAARLALHGVRGAGADEARRVLAVERELRRAELAVRDLEAAPAGGRTPAAAVALDLGALVPELAAGWRELAAAHGAELRVARTGEPVPVSADPARIAQALANLVANAAEHGRGPVLVRVRAAAGHARVEVRDHGHGLAAPPRRRARAGRAGRRGHGLRVARRVAVEHGGRLLTAPVPSGACVVLELPLAEAAACRARSG